MPKHWSFRHVIPSFKGHSTFKPPEPAREKDLLDQEIDPSLLPEEKGTIRRYLKYADTLLNASDETPADTEPADEVSGRVSRDKKAA
jgi:hypothetical protein